MGALVRELRDVLRELSRSPLFTAAALLSLALGIGAGTAAYGALESALLDPLGGADTTGLVALDRPRGPRNAVEQFRLEEYEALRSGSADVLSGLVAHAPAGVELRDGHLRSHLRATIVSGDYFDVVGVRRAAIGRLLTPDDARRPDIPVAVITHTAWRRRFGGDPNVVGRTLTLDEAAFTVVGVAPAGFHGVYRTRTAEVFLPVHAAAMMSQDAAEGVGRLYVFRLAGRLKPDVTATQARSVLSAILQHAGRPDDAPHGGHRVALLPAAHAAVESKFRERLRSVTLALAGLGIAALLVAWANVAGLLVARAADRQRAEALRVALGASLLQVARPRLIEALVLSGLGAFAGLRVAFWLFDGVRRFGLPGIDEAGLELRLHAPPLLFVVAASLIGAVGLGLVSAGQAVRGARLHLGSRDLGGAGVRRRGGLVALQVALCLPMLVATALFLRSMVHAADYHPGFDPDHVLMARVAGLGGTETHGVLQELRRRARKQPAVVAASVIDGRQSEALSVDGTPIEGLVAIDHVAPDYFDVFDLPAVQGRVLNRADAGTDFVVVNEMLARRIAPNASVLGRRVTIRAGIGPADEDGPLEVVGVVKNIRWRGPGERGLGSTGFEPRLYLARPPRHSPPPIWSLAVKTREPSATTTHLLREAQAALADRASLRVSPFRDQLEGRLRQYQRRVPLVAGFGLVATVLCAVGLYALQARSVTRRTREIGLRMAVGATAAAILWRIIREGLATVITGLALGAVFSRWAMHLIAAELMGVAATDVPTLGAATLGLVAVGLLACAVPAARAARIDPVAALRCE